MIKLRQYQEDALAAEAKHRIDHPDETRLAIVLPTGAGKTITFAARAASFLSDELYRVQSAGLGGLPRKVLILVHTDELAQQARAKVELVASKWNVGIVKAEYNQVDAQIIIGSVQTLANPARRAQISDVGLVIVDECHHAVAASYQAIMRHFGCLGCICLPYAAGGDGPERECPEHGDGSATPALGFTATLERGDGQGLGEIWQDVAYSRDISWGVRKGFLVEPVGYRLELDVKLTYPTPGDVSPRFMDDQMIEGLAPQRIVEKWTELAKDRPTVAFMPLVRSAIALADQFTLAGVPATWISGTLPAVERRMRLKGYEEGQYQVLVNAMVLTEGWDSPRTKCVIVGRPTKSRSLFIQMAGRGLRPVPGIPVEDQDCILIAVADATTDLCSIADLSDRPLPREAQGSLTAMEDEWDIGKALDEPGHLWTGHVSAAKFDPIVTRSSKAWKRTERGTPFLPIAKDRQYVFVVGTGVYMRAAGKVSLLHADLPDLELALTLAEQEAEDRGGDIGRLIADKNRAWRKQIPSIEMQSFAKNLGLEAELNKIMGARAGGKAGKVADLIDVKLATRTLEPLVERIKAGQ